MKNTIITIMAAIAAAFALSSCCSQPDLAGKWTVESIGGQTLSQETPGLEELPFIEFDVTEGRVHGNSGINILNSTFTQDGKSLKFGMAASTMMAGPEEAMQVERNFLDAFGRVASAKVSGKEILELSDAEGNVLMVLKRAK